MIAAAVAAFQAGYALDHLRLELEHGVHAGVDAAGYRLTASERQYRAQWLDTVRHLPADTQRSFLRQWDAAVHSVEPR